MSKEFKISIIKVIISVLILICAKVINLSDNIKLALYIISYAIVGYEVIISAIKTIFTEFSLDETVLMTVATIGAFVLGDYSEAVFVMIFYQIGELFQDYSYDKSRNSIKTLIDIKPEFANIYHDGKVTQVDPSSVNVGDIILVNPYEKIPLDGEIVDGSTTLNTSILTGESIPRFVTVGDVVSSGLINNEKVIKIKVTKSYNDSTASKILDLIENAADKKSKSEKFITSFAKIYTPIVCLIALLTFLIPLLYKFLILKEVSDISTFVYRALTVLVISCPCAILISVPIAFFSTLGAASKNGILIKGSNYIETLAKVKKIVFDKTGTMTKGVFEVVGIHHCKMNEDDLIRYVAHIEYFSNHPIAKSILKYYGKDIDIDAVNSVTELGGKGLSGVALGKKLLVGSEQLMIDNNIKYIKCSDIGTIVHVAIDGIYEGHILINDIIKENAKLAIKKIEKLGISKIIMLTGDAENIAKDVATKIGISEYKSNLLPNDKLNIVDKLIDADGKLLFVGDGINDAPCITRSDVGMAMGSIGSDSAIDLADVVVMDDDIIKVPLSIQLSKKNMRIVYENIIFSIGIKIIVLILSVFGISYMWLAVFSDVGVMILAVINSVRLLYVKH